MYRIEHRKLPNPKYCLTYSEAKWLCKVYGISTRSIKTVN